MIILLALQNHQKIYQIDVKLAFLNDVLEKEVYVEQLLNYVKKSKEDKVYWLRKALYELKQTPRTWYPRTVTYFLNHSFYEHPYKQTLYIKTNKDRDLAVVDLNIDDLIFTSN